MSSQSSSTDSFRASSTDNTARAEDSILAEFLADRPVSGRLTLQLIDALGAQAGQPLRDNPYNEVKFYYNGELIDLDFGAVNGPAATYESLLAAIQAALAANPQTQWLTAELGDEFTYKTNDGGETVAGRQIVITTKLGFLYILEDANCGWFASGPGASEAELHANISAGWTPAHEFTFPDNTGDTNNKIEGTPENDLIKAGNHFINATSLAGEDVVVLGKEGNYVLGGSGDDVLIAGDDSSFIWGQEGNDIIIAYDNVGTIFGHEGNDIIWVGDNSDNIWGHDGDDILIAGNNVYSIYGDDGNDKIYVGNHAYTIWGGDGNDIIYAGNESSGIRGDTGSDLIIAGDNASYIYGNEGDDIIEAGDEAENIYGGTENDKITVGDYSSSVYGDEGDDIIDAGDNVRDIVGGEGNDTINVGDSANHLDGEDGDDHIKAATGAQVIYGGAGDDIIEADDNAGYVYGGAGNDIIILANGSFRIYGDEGNDHIKAGNGVEFIEGGDGDDIIEAGDNAHYISSGEGNDIINVDNSALDIFGGAGNDTITTGDNCYWVEGYEGNDIIRTGNGAKSIFCGAGNDTITVGNDAGVLAEGIYGDEGDDTIEAGNNAEYVCGGAGNDTIIAGDDARLVLGGEGDDAITVGDNAYDIEGERGDDIIVVGADAIFIYGGEGNDTITAGNSARNIGGGAGDDIITVGDSAGGYNHGIDGGEGDDTITAGARTSYIYGGDGDDHIKAGIEAEKVYGGDGNDIIEAEDDAKDIYGGAGNDIITLANGAVGIYGDEGDDTITAGNNALDIFGGEGDDTIIVGDDASVIMGDDFDDVIGGKNMIRTGDRAAGVYGGTGEDTITVGDNCHTIYGDAGDDRIEAGAYVEAVVGGDGDDRIEAGAYASDINGGVGNDTIIVGNNASGLYGGEGDDTITGGDNFTMVDGGEGNDIITGGDYFTRVDGDAGDDSITAGANAYFIFGGDGNDTLTVGENANGVYGGEGNDILISNYVDQTVIASGGTGTDIIIGNQNTPSLELLSLQSITDFEILLRAITADVTPLDFTSHARLETYGITVLDPDNDDVVRLSDAWTLSAEKSTPAVDVFTSFQNGTTLELEIWNEKSTDFVLPVTASEKLLGQPVALTVAQEGYYISQVLGQGQYGHLEESDGKWYYVLDQAIDSGPVAGANTVANADTVTVEIRNQAGQTWEYNIPVSIVDDAPEITIASDQSSAVFYPGADGGSLIATINDQHLLIELGGDAITLQGSYGTLRLTRSQEAGDSTASGYVYAMEYTQDASAQTTGTDTFSFQITDGDGDVATSIVAFTNNEPAPGSPVTAIDQLTFREDNLASGSDPDYVPLVQNGELAYNLPSGLSEVRIAHAGMQYAVAAGNYENLITDRGVFTVWQQAAGTIGYSFILANNMLGQGEEETITFEAILTDGSGNVFAGNMIDIHIIDDEPRVLENPELMVDAANPDVSGNAGSYYLAGADGGVFTWRNEDQTLAEAANYGELTLDKDGDFAFSLNPDALAEGQTEIIALGYDFADADGDSIAGEIYLNLGGFVVGA